MQWCLLNAWRVGLLVIAACMLTDPSSLPSLRAPRDPIPSSSLLPYLLLGTIKLAPRLTCPILIKPFSVLTNLVYSAAASPLMPISQTLATIGSHGGTRARHRLCLLYPLLTLSTVAESLNLLYGTGFTLTTSPPRTPRGVFGPFGRSATSSMATLTSARG